MCWCQQQQDRWGKHLLLNGRLNFGVFSYCGRVEITFISCRRIVPDPTFLAECLDGAYRELVGALGLARRMGIAHSTGNRTHTMIGVSPY
jgi:hypothetical protein